MSELLLVLLTVFFWVNACMGLSLLRLDKVRYSL